MQAGIIEEMLEDTFEGLEEDDLEEAAQEEVEKVLFEVTKGTVKLQLRVNRGYYMAAWRYKISFRLLKN